MWKYIKSLFSDCLTTNVNGNHEWIEKIEKYYTEDEIPVKLNRKIDVCKKCGISYEDLPTKDNTEG